VSAIGLSDDMTHVHENEFEAHIFADRVAVVFNDKRVSGRKTAIDLICLFQYTVLHNIHAIYRAYIYI